MTEPPAAPPAAPALYAPGDRVRTRAADPAWHTRLPLYARGRTGRVLDVTGSWPLADDVARRRAQPRVEPVYSVAFAARELWGEGTHEVRLDLWQSYLEPVTAPGRGRPADPAGTAGPSGPSGAANSPEEDAT
jgi:Nitrile hydratase beta subunit